LCVKECLKLKISDNRSFALAWHAQSAFRTALSVAQLMHELRISDTDTRSATLYGAFVGYYGRPFLKSKVLEKLPQSIVPNEYRKLHARLISDRNQIFLHTDGDADFPDIKKINHLRAVIHPNHAITIHGIAPIPKSSYLAECCELVTLLDKLINTALEEYVKLNLKHELPQPGSYTLSNSGERFEFKIDE
jgi:hypothetical protein